VENKRKNGLGLEKPWKLPEDFGIYNMISLSIEVFECQKEDKKFDLKIVREILHNQLEINRMVSIFNTC